MAGHKFQQLTVQPAFGGCLVKLPILGLCHSLSHVLPVNSLDSVPSHMISLTCNHGPCIYTPALHSQVARLFFPYLLGLSSVLSFVWPCLFLACLSAPCLNVCLDRFLICFVCFSEGRHVSPTVSSTWVFLIKDSLLELCIPDWLLPLLHMGPIQLLAFQTTGIEPSRSQDVLINIREGSSTFLKINELMNTKKTKQKNK